MKKQVKKVGNSIGITFTAEEQRIYGLELGSVIDLIDMVVLDNKTSPRTSKRLKTTNLNQPKSKNARS